MRREAAGRQSPRKAEKPKKDRHIPPSFVCNGHGGSAGDTPQTHPTRRTKEAKRVCAETAALQGTRTSRANLCRPRDARVLHLSALDGRRRRRLPGNALEAHMPQRALQRFRPRARMGHPRGVQCLQEPASEAQSPSRSGTRFHRRAASACRTQRGRAPPKRQTGARRRDGAPRSRNAKRSTSTTTKVTAPAPSLPFWKRPTTPFASA